MSDVHSKISHEHFHFNNYEKLKLFLLYLRAYLNYKVPIFSVNLFQMSLHGVCTQILMLPKIFEIGETACKKITIYRNY